MTAAAQPRATYWGDGVPKLPPGRGREAFDLPGADDATLLPDPLRTYRDLFDRLMAATQRDPSASPANPRPLLTQRQAHLVANFITFALRNDLRTIDPYDAAVVWEKWRVAVADLRDLLRNADRDPEVLGVVANVLDHRIYGVSADLATALTKPGQVFEHYCPWRTDWATYKRIHPEAV